MSITERSFSEWLNERRGLIVAEVFHDIIGKYKEAISTAPVAPKAEQADGTPGARTVWLTEDQDHFPRHRWLRIVDAGKTAYLTWEHDANIATHFARRDDAVCFQKLHLEFCALSIVTEHAFIDATRDARGKS